MLKAECFFRKICFGDLSIEVVAEKKTIFLLCSLGEEGAAAGSTKKEGKLHHRSLRN